MDYLEFSFGVTPNEPEKNVNSNNCKIVNVYKAEVNLLQRKLFNTILANINKNILLDSSSQYAGLILNGGVVDLVMSGFFESDMSDIEKKLCVTDFFRTTQL